MKKNEQHFNSRDFDAVKNIALQFPGAEESVSHENTPSVKVNGKLMCRLHDNGEFIPIRIGFENREHYLETYPELFLLPDHFKNYPYICMWAHASDKKLLKEILELSWKNLASKKQLAEWNTKKI